MNKKQNELMHKNMQYKDQNMDICTITKNV